jgi:hypothetical protein
MTSAQLRELIASLASDAARTAPSSYASPSERATAPAGADAIPRPSDDRAGLSTKKDG